MKINLDISSRCTLECPKCLRMYYKVNGKKVPGHDMTLKEYHKIISYFSEVQFCGNISDPTMNNLLPTFLEINYQNEIETTVDNAASHRPKKWYEKAFKSNPNATWIFGLDGIPEQSHLYRINQDGVKLFEMMLLAKKEVKNVIWNYIIFKYNENDLEEAQKLSNHYGLNISFIKSSRFNKKDKYKPVNPNHYVERNYENVKTKMSEW